MFLRSSLVKSALLPLVVSLTAGAGLLGHVSPALAAEGTLPGGATLKFEFLMINQDGGDLVRVDPTTIKARQYFNMAHCVCSSSKAGKEQNFSYQMRLVPGTTPVNRPGEVWMGSQCDNDTQRPMMCSRVDSAGIGDLQAISVTPATPLLPIGQLMSPTGGACQEREVDGTVWVLVDGDASGAFDYAPSSTIKTDTLGPPLPTNFVAAPAESAIQLDWTAPVQRISDVQYYQALCAKADGTPALTKPSHPAQYQTVRDLCGLDLKLTLTPAEIAAGNTAVTAVPDGIANLDPAFVCGQAETTATAMRIEGLENDVEYTVALVSVDLYGNPTGTYFTKTLTPKPVTDFWEDMIDRGGKIDGGFCLMAQTYGDQSALTQALRGFRDNTLQRTAFGRALTRAYYNNFASLGQYVAGSWALRIIVGVLMLPLVALAFAWHALSLPGLLLLIAALVMWRRRRHAPRFARRLAPAVGASLGLWLLFGATAAQAQSNTRPYWEEGVSEDADIDYVRWHIGIRVGPYTPAIDKQFVEDGGTGPAPYAAMFGTKYSITPSFDVDRIIWRGFGHVGVGGSIGYLGKTAKAFASGSDPNDPDRMRSTGDSNTFRLIPMAATASYRFTYLDDAYHIPLVPYVRGGLAYYVWWVKAPNGNIAQVGTNKAMGGSLGVQGAIGLSLRAERIDADAAMSMREGGIEHAGFYAELSTAQVDGFGSEGKLAVGDTTWFAGVDFEF